MMVDDESTTLDVIEMYLREKGYQHFVRATDGSQTLDLMARERPDILLLNLVMPEADGLDVLRSMAMDENLRDIPVILVTSCADAETKQKALAHGAADFLAKPVDSSELTLRVRNTLAASAAQAGAPLVSRLDGKSPQCGPILRTFVGRLHERLQEMETSLASGDFTSLERAAHWLKGAAGTVGFDAFTDPAATLLLYARERKVSEVEVALHSLQRLADRVVILDEGE